VFGRRCHRSTVRARRTGHSGSRTPSGFSGALVHRCPIAPIARGDPCGGRARRPSGCRTSGGRPSGSSPPGSGPPGIARPSHGRALLMFDFGQRNIHRRAHSRV